MRILRIRFPNNHSADAKEAQIKTIIPRLKLKARQAKRLPMNLAIRNLVKWEPQGEIEDGYTIAIACMKALAPIAVANLKLCTRTSIARLREIILVFDCTQAEIPEEVIVAARAASSTAAVTLVGYDHRQYKIARRINWGWVYSWMSWSLAIGRARTRAVLIHDLDAMPLDPALFEKIYDHWLESGADFCGIRNYSGNGVTTEMDLVTTFELVLDAAYVRQRFCPFDLFNKLVLVDGRIVDFDTMLHAQWLSPKRAARPIEESSLTHPSQMICQYTDLVSGRTDLGDRVHVLPMLPYFMSLGGDAGPMLSAKTSIAQPGSRTADFLGHHARIDHIPPEHWAWLEKQIRRLEQAIHGFTSPEVAEYLTGFVQRSGTCRTVGRELGPNAVRDI